MRFSADGTDDTDECAGGAERASDEVDYPVDTGQVLCHLRMNFQDPCTAVPLEWSGVPSGAERVSVICGMEPYTVYFSIGDKKLKMVVLAEGPLAAQEEVRNKLRILKTEAIPLDELVPEDKTFNAILDMLDDTIDLLKGKPQPRPRPQTWAELLTKRQQPKARK
jgi:hypothetical protein